MNTNQKISFLLADYAVRIIAARHFPELAKLEPIRSVKTADTAYYTANAAYAAANAARYAANAATHADAAAYADTAAAAAYAAYYAANYTTSVMYANDIRALINIAIDPDRYW